MMNLLSLKRYLPGLQKIFLCLAAIMILILSAPGIQSATNRDYGKWDISAANYVLKEQSDFAYDKDWVVTNTADRQIIITANIDLSMDIIDATRDLVIYADSVNIQNNLKSPGRNIEIYTQSLNITDGVIIDLSGSPPGPRPQKPERPKDLSRHGLDGADGTEGKHSGSANIMAESVNGHFKILANGGDGGEGQDGGDGSDGLPGSNGVSQNDKVVKIPDGKNPVEY